jgi:hypothetical protein
MKICVWIVFMAILISCDPMAGRFRTKYCDNHPDLQENVRKAILEGRIIIGMTKEQVRAACGTPMNRKKGENDSGNSEIWFYGYGEEAIHFSDSVVVEITSRTIKHP